MPNQLGGVSVLSYLQKIRSGVVFSEGFENDNFINAEGWVTVQGIPSNTSAQYKQGIKSFICSGTATTLSIIKKTISSYVADSSIVECWFYDDGTTTAGTGPYFKVKTSAGSYWQVGVRNDVSTGFYVYGGKNQDVIATISTVARSVGWHKFEVYIAPLGTHTNIIIDANSFVMGASSDVATTYASEVSLCSGKTTDTVGTFGYFDSVFVFQTYYVSVLGSSGLNRRGIFTDDTGTILFTGTLPFNYQIDGDGVETNTWPFVGQFQISQPSPSSAIVEFVSSTLNLYPGDIYSYNPINFGRKVEVPPYVPTALKQINQSPSGVVETLLNGLKDRLAFVINQLQGFYWFQVAQNWFEAVVGGQSFTLMTDNTFDIAFGSISATVLAGQSTVTIIPNLSTNPTDNFTVNTLTNGVYANNYFYILRTKENTKKQVVTVASKTSTTLTFNEILNFDVGLLDQVYSQYLFPLIEIDSSDLNGFTVFDKNIPSYNWNQKFKEYNNG